MKTVSCSNCKNRFEAEDPSLYGTEYDIVGVLVNGDGKHIICSKCKCGSCLSVVLEEV